MSQRFGKKIKSIKKRIRQVIWSGLFLLALLTVNFCYQIYHKPSELLRLMPNAEAKQPEQTWKAYRQHFEEYQRGPLKPSFLAALVQTESAGNPFASPDWRLSLLSKPDRLFAPASSSLGLLQFTEGTFRMAIESCEETLRMQRDERCAWRPFGYYRIVPAHAIELASVLLHSQLQRVLRKGIALAEQDQQDVAAAIHLCGEGAVLRQLQASGFQVGRLKSLQCGSHSLQAYLRKLRDYQRQFLKIAQREQNVEYNLGRLFR